MTCHVKFSCGLSNCVRVGCLYDSRALYLFFTCIPIVDFCR